MRTIVQFPRSAIGCPMQGLFRCAQEASRLRGRSSAKGLSEAEDLVEVLAAEDDASAATSGRENASQQQDRIAARLAEMTDSAMQGDTDEQGFFGPPALSDSETTEDESTGPATPPNEAAGKSPEDEDKSDYIQPEDIGLPGKTFDPSAIPRTPEESLRLLQKEFGECSYLPQAERFLFSVHSALLRGVIIRGTLFVTTHRICYFALLPALEDEFAAQPIQKLSATVYYSCSGPNGRKRDKIYCVLDSESMSAFPSSKKRLRPIGVCHFSSMTEVHAFPTDFQARPNVVTFKYIRRSHKKQAESLGEMEFDDAESAAQWRNELAAAFFRYHNERDRYKASVPYDRIDKIDQLDWHAFSHVLTFTVNRAPIGQPAEHQRLDLGFLKRTSWVIARIKAGMLSVREEIKKWDSPLPRSQIPLLDIYSPHNPHQAPMQRMSSRSNSISQQPSELAPATSLDEQPTTGEYDDADLDERYAPTQRDQDRFHYVFGLAPDEHLVTVIPSYYVRSIPALGQLAIGPNGVMFLRKTKMMSDVKILVPVDQLKGASESSTIVAGVSSLHVHLKGHPDISFNFKNKKRRDWAIKCIEALAKEETAKPHGKSAVRKRASTVHSEPEALSALESWHLSSYAGQKRPTMAPELVNMFPRVIGGEGLAAKFNLEHLNVCCLTIGSRGDVQPYIALCQGLMKEGHKVCIASHPEYKEWVNSYGIEHQSVGGDPSILMEVSVGGKMFAPETLKRFREWFDRLLLESYEAVKGHDLLIESPSTFAGIHIAEALKIAYFRAFTMPFTKTADFPHAFMNGPVPLTRAYNLSTYLLFDQIMWRASSGQINKWRKETLHLPATDLDSLHIRDVPFIYNFSEAVVPRPMDWPNSTLISGYWFVESDDDEYTPPDSLVAFMKKARADDKPLVYCGFGSITIPDPAALTQAVIESVKAADVRMILAKGWSARRSADRTDTIALPDTIYQIDAIPHEWLFKQVDACIHHGGSGTTAAALRFGVPCGIKPFFGDQHFWANRVKALGAGVRVKSLSADDMTDAWKKLTRNRMMKEKAELISQQIQAENGVQQAIQFIYSYMGSSLEARGGHGSKAEDLMAKADASDEAGKDASTVTKLVNKVSVLVDKMSV